MQVLGEAEPKAFTVKHELVTWLRRNPCECEVWRVPDGLWRDREGAVITEQVWNEVGELEGYDGQ